MRAGGFPLDLFSAPGADEEWIAEFLAWEMQVGAEDKVLVERVQKGVRAGVGAGRTSRSQSDWSPTFSG